MAGSSHANPTRTVQSSHAISLAQRSTPAFGGRVSSTEAIDVSPTAPTVEHDRHLGPVVAAVRLVCDALRSPRRRRWS
jgi:hypothetical protein